MKFEQILEEFDFQLNLIQENNPDVIERANKTIALCTGVLTIFRKEIVKNGFKDVEAEIFFFKYIKQFPLISLVYSTEVRSFELQFPKGNPKSQHKNIESKIKKINEFFNCNRDFSQYVKYENFHFDMQYYTRENLGLNQISYAMSYFQDPEFSSARDLLLAKLKAYEMFILYLQNRMNVPASSSTILPKLQWTASKAALTELIYALFLSGSINNGSAEIKEIAIFFERNLSVDLGNYYHTSIEIGSRKGSKTKFLDRLRIFLLGYFDDSDG